MPGFIQSISIMLEKFVDKHKATMRKKGWRAGRQTARNYFAEVNVIDVEMEVGGGRWGKKLRKQVDSLESVTICHVEPG